MSVRIISPLGLFAAIAALAAACAAEATPTSTTLSPTPTAVPPTATAVLPTATAVLPTATAVLPTATAVPATPPPTQAEEPAGTPPTEVANPPATFTPEDLAPITLPEREVSFRVRVPDNTPPDDPVYLRVLTFGDWSWSKSVRLEPGEGGVLTGVILLEEGALVRYVYDRWDEQEWGEPFKNTREAHGDAVRIENRYLLVTDDLLAVEDTVETWNDLRSRAPTGVLTGLVVDAVTGQPLMDTNVSVAGIHTATDYDGEFTIDGLASAAQRIVTYRTTGDYRPASFNVEVPPSGTAHVAMALSAAQPVNVTFDIDLPQSTPPDATVQLVGSVHQTGAQLGDQNVPHIAADFALPTLRRVASDRAVGTVSLHAGTYLQYYYSIGSSSWGREGTEGGTERYRSLVVDGAKSAYTRRDRVETWRQPGAVRVTLQVTTPANTNPDIPLALWMGPAHWMTRLGPHRWTFFMYDYPGNEFQYRYLLGGDGLGADGTSGLAEGGFRRIVIPESDAVLVQVIDRWEFQPTAVPLGDSGTSKVTFRVSVPSTTPRGSSVRLVGDAPELIRGIPMAPQPGNPWMYEATVQLAAYDDLTYHYDRGAAGTASTRTHTSTVRFTNHVFDDWVVRWSDSLSDSLAPRPDYMNGIYTPDFWSPSFLRASPTTFGSIVEHNGGWVAISSVWSYGQINPLPLVEPRRIHSPSVLTPREDIAAQARIAHDQGLKVFLSPQFNMEMGAGGLDALGGAKSALWWNAWVAEAERLWLWNATVAEEIGAEAMMLPGYVFHVFADPGAYDPPEYMAEFDARMAELVDRVRDVYGGKLMMSGGVQELDFPGDADLLGVTTYDIGRPDLPYDATVDHWREAYDTLFIERVDPIYDRWGKPVFFYTAHAPAFSDNPDPINENAQARQLEGFFQAMATRPWIAGSLSWAYHMIPAPLDGGDGIRGRLAEAVFAKYYGQYLGLD